MAQYELKKKSRFSRRVEVRKSRVELRLVPLILSLLVAFVVWLYIEGSLAEQPETPPTGQEITDVQKQPGDSAP
jgi:hypothetical protein